jgi:hypothetical protein
MAILFKSRKSDIHHTEGIMYFIDVREYRRGNQKRTTQRNWQYKTNDEDKQNQSTTQYVMDTIIRKQTQIT